MTQSPFLRALPGQDTWYICWEERSESNLLWTRTFFFSTFPEWWAAVPVLFHLLQIGFCSWPRNQLIGWFVLGFQQRTRLPHSLKHFFSMLKFWVPDLTNFLIKKLQRAPGMCSKLPFDATPLLTKGSFPSSSCPQSYLLLWQPQDPTTQRKGRSSPWG